LNRLLFIICFIIFCPAVLIAQDQEGEYLRDLDYNPELIIKFANDPDKSASSRASEGYYFLTDTIEIPFVDDFSSNRLSYYWINLYPENYIFDSVAINFRVNGIEVDSLPFRLTSAYRYIHNTGNNTIDSFALPSFIIHLFQAGPHPNNPFIPSDTIEAWPPYYRWYINDQEQLDSILINDLDGFLRKEVLYTHAVDVRYRNALWMDSYVYINNSFGINPPTIGVATFDGINDRGRAYVSGQNTHGIADYLTSKPLNLAYQVSDSLYLSFYYQPQGLGNPPEAKDSLALEFWSPQTRRWQWMWSTPGSELQSFRQVIIPVTDEQFLQKGFQFRFRNFANLSGNVDHWNIDYVRLDRNRSYDDLFPDDVAFTQPANYLLKNYTQMPWKQFLANPEAEIYDSLIVNMKNNSALPKVVNYTYQITDMNNNVVLANTSTGSEDPDIYFNYKNKLNTNPFPGWSANYKEFEVMNIIRASVDINRNNDTIRHLQKFDNFYAYDDGIPEAAYGLNRFGAKLACRFDLNTPDTLTAVRMAFTPINYSSEFLAFRPTIWSSLNPEVVLYQDQDFSYPQYPGIHGYTEYQLPALPVSGTIYVGFVQFTQQELNIGFDKNNDHRLKNYFNVSGTWQASGFAGSLMINPVFGVSNDPTVGLEQPKTDIKNSFKIYPNPARSQFFIASNSNESLNVTVYDTYGRKIFTDHNYSFGAIDVSHWAKGIYFIRISDNEGNIPFTGKIIITN
jgi:hypothetical protein